jgi:hypothetical protein
VEKRAKALLSKRYRVRHAFETSRSAWR